MTRLYIFDLDGTLVDSREDLAGSVNATRAAYKLKPLSVEEVTGFVGEGARLLIERSLADAPGLPIDEALRRFAAHYLEHCTDRTTLCPGVRETLAALRLRAALAVVTNKPAAMTEKVLRRFGIADWFAAVLGGDSEKRKPDPEPVQEVLRRTGVPAGEALMVGDGWTDIAAGRAAGVRTCYVRGLGDEKQADEAGPDSRIDRLDALLGG